MSFFQEGTLVSAVLPRLPARSGRCVQERVGGSESACALQTAAPPRSVSVAEARAESHRGLDGSKRTAAGSGSRWQGRVWGGWEAEGLTGWGQQSGGVCAAHLRRVLRTPGQVRTSLQPRPSHTCLGEVWPLKMPPSERDDESQGQTCPQELWMAAGRAKRNAATQKRRAEAGWVSQEGRDRGRHCFCFSRTFSPSFPAPSQGLGWCPLHRLCPLPEFTR